MERLSVLPARDLVGLSAVSLLLASGISTLFFEQDSGISVRQLITYISMITVRAKSRSVGRMVE